MSEYGNAVEFGMVRFERLLPGPIERVWGGSLTLTFHHSRLAPRGEKAPEKHAGAEGYSFTARVTLPPPPVVPALPLWGIGATALCALGAERLRRR